MLHRSNFQTAARLAVVLLGPLYAFAAVAAPATVSVGDAQVTVTNGMATTMRFTVTRSGEMGDSAVVQYRTRDGTAKAGTDHTATSGTSPIALATGDFNSDGKPDVAVANLSSAVPTVSVLLNNQYQVSVEYSLGVGTIRYVSAP